MRPHAAPGCCARAAAPACSGAGRAAPLAAPAACVAACRPLAASPAPPRAASPALPARLRRCCSVAAARPAARGRVRAAAADGSSDASAAVASTPASDAVAAGLASFQARKHADAVKHFTAALGACAMRAAAVRLKLLKQRPQNPDVARVLRRAPRVRAAHASRSPLTRSRRPPVRRSCLADGGRVARRAVQPRVRAGGTVTLRRRGGGPAPSVRAHARDTRARATPHATHAPTCTRACFRLRRSRAPRRSTTALPLAAAHTHACIRFVWSAVRLTHVTLLSAKTQCECVPA
jgi:hypothetical protein